VLGRSLGILRIAKQQTEIEVSRGISGIQLQRTVQQFSAFSRILVTETDGEVDQ
jgi:hypothetical protein